ncbi:hypothetical protein [Candidatus Poriferisodalis sp.]|uniref:hypothetical protein n=1 Tax=Candidatus Poriferisodalis sp. TaxID=3101277 RepID=UPI003AF5A187
MSVGRTAESVPFGIADVINGPAGVRLRVPLSAYDPSGPLHGARQETVVGTSEVYDLCVDAEAFEAITGQAYRAGDLFPQNTYAELRFDRLRMGCDGEPVEPGRSEPRWALRTNDRGGSVRFHSREEALEYREERFASHQVKFGNTIDAHAYGVDPNGTGFQPLIEFADRDAPMDDVRVLPDTVAVNHGVLRGLMRNWSRAQWAYGVTVHAEGRSWSWPLSIQPGELAPFEIEDWSGSDYPAFTVTAEMAPEADLSRNWGISGVNGTLYGNANSPELSHYPERVLDILPKDGRHELWLSFAELGGALSHPSIPGRDSGYQPGIDDLRAYVAFVEYRLNQQGEPVLADGRRPVTVSEVERLTLFGALAHGGTAEVDRYPLARMRNDWLDDSVWVLFVDSDRQRGGWLMWMGGAHPQ